MQSIDYEAQEKPETQEEVNNKIRNLIISLQELLMAEKDFAITQYDNDDFIDKGEALANLTLAFRHIEDAEHRFQNYVNRQITK